MAEKGFVVDYIPDRKYGFIRRPGRKGDVFFHLADVEGHAAPVRGQHVTFEPYRAPKGEAARNVSLKRVPRSPVVFFLLLAGALTLGGIAYAFHLGAPLIVAHLCAITFVTFLLYGIDKSAARAGKTRIPENVLHLGTLVGGTAGAFLGQAVFRHKTRKKSFRLVFAAIVVVQVVLLGVWAYCWMEHPPWFPEELRFIFPE